VDQVPEKSTNRRNVITGIAAVGIGGPLLAACGSSATYGGAGTGAGSGGGTNSTPTPASGSTSPAAHATSGGSSSQTALVKASAVPVGGGVILNQAVVTQPTAGTFKAFSNVCTHQGCTVAQIQNQQILCPCHGSAFSISTGAVEGGPAPSPLAPIAITDKNGEIFAT
jgi:Rieske Fe-S protein